MHVATPASLSAAAEGKTHGAPSRERTGAWRLPAAAILPLLAARLPVSTTAAAAATARAFALRQRRVAAAAAAVLP